MKAIIYTAYGSPANLQLKDVNKPVPTDGQVLVKMHCASINSWDWDLVRGKPFLVRLIGGLFKPKATILGADIAGVVEAVGTGVKEFKPGDAVFGDIAVAGFGGFAEYVAVAENLLAPKPESLSFEQAAALPQAGLLALQGLRYGGDVKPGQQVLFNGAGGGVGTWGLQYAKYKGAEVTCVDREEKFDLLRSLGADFLVDYTREDYTRRGKQYDTIVDVIAHRSPSDYARVLKLGGTFAMIGGNMGWLLFLMIFLSSFISWRTKKKIGMMGYRPNRADLDLLAQLCKEGKVVPVIDRVYPLGQVREAFEYFSTGMVKGKILISIIRYS